MFRTFRTARQIAAFLLAPAACLVLTGTGCQGADGVASGPGKGAKDTATGPIVVNPPDTTKSSTRKALPFTLSPVFVPDGLMGDFDLEGFQLDPQTYEVRFAARPGKQGFAGVAWLNNRNWNDSAAAVAIDSGATRFIFEAKGAAGGETIKAGLGGAATPRTAITLTADWQTYEAPIPDGFSYASSLVLFVTVVEAPQAPVAWRIRKVVLR